MATEAQASPARLLQANAGILRRTLDFANRHPVWALFLLALLIRVAVSIGIALVHPSNIAPDGIQYSRLASDMATGHTAGWDAYFHTLYTRTAILEVPITGLYKVFGTHQLLGQLYVALLGAGTAAITARLAMEVLARRWALAAGLIVALLPSQIVWSSLILKDAAVWIALAGLALTIAVAGRTRGGRPLLALGLAAAGLLVALGYLRFQTLVVGSWALMLAAPFAPRPRRLLRVGGAVAIGVLIPWLVFDLGPAGLTYVRASRAPSEQRVLDAAGAASAIPPDVVKPSAPPAVHPGGAASSTKPGTTSPSRKPGTTSTGGKPGTTSTGGRTGTTSNGRTSTTPSTTQPSSTPRAQPTQPSTSNTISSAPPGEAAADLHHLPRGILAMLVQPYPWQTGGSLSLNLARLDAIVWYPILLLAFVGLLTLRPRHLRVMAFPLLAGGAILILYALTEGNLGTAFRHRGEFEWVIALLAGFGLTQVAVWWSRVRSPGPRLGAPPAKSLSAPSE